MKSDIFTEDGKHRRVKKQTNLSISASKRRGLDTDSWMEGVREDGEKTEREAMISVIDPSVFV